MNPVEPSSGHRMQNPGGNGQDDDDRVPEWHQGSGVPVEAREAAESIHTPDNRAVDNAAPTKMDPYSRRNKSNASVQLFVSIGRSAPITLHIGEVRNDVELFMGLNRCYYGQRSFRDRLFGLKVPIKVQFNKVGDKMLILRINADQKSFI
jgi:hypothetical protein